MKAHPDVNGEEYIKKHFKQLLGKIYAPFNDNTIYSLALDNGKGYEVSNKHLLDELAKSFYIAECKLGDEPNIVLQESFLQGCEPSETAKNGVLMVMMENYANKSAIFLRNGKLAIGIKYTKDSMEIIEHLQTIGYVLFHTRKNTDQHLFAIKGICSVKSAEELEEDRYRNVTTTDIYVSANLDISTELDSSNIRSTNKAFTPISRYDSQYSKLSLLQYVSR